MPLIMDGRDDEYMDDLFGDSEPAQNDLFGENEAIQISQPSSSIPKPVIDRLEEIRIGGCCSKIAWSNSGAVASILPGGRRVVLRVFQRNVRRRSWDFGEELPLSINPTPEAPRIVHLSWNMSGSILALMDACGRVGIFSSSGAIGKLQQVRNHEQDDEDDSSKIVSCYWLPLTYHQGFIRYIKSATKSASTGAWSYQSVLDRTPGPFHPWEGRSALVCLTESGKIRLLYDTPNGWAEKSIDLGAASYSDEYITHASFAPDKEGKLLLATHSASGQCEVFAMRINWNERRQNIQGQQQVVGVDPQMLTTHLNTVPAFAPYQSILDPQDPQSVANFRDTSLAQLTHLEFLPGTFERNWQERKPAQLIAIFSHVRNIGNSNQAVDDFSILSSWDINISTPSLHPAFKDINPKAKNAKFDPSTQRCTSQRKPDIIFDGNVLRIQPLRFNTVLALVLADGSVNLRDCTSLDLISPEIESEQVSTLPHSGYTFDHNSSGISLDVGFSPNGCIIVAIDPEGKFRQRKMGLAPLWTDDFQPEQPIIALVAQYATATMYSWSNDDVLAIVPSNTKRELVNQFLRDLYTSLGFSVDYTTEDSQRQKMIVTGLPIPKCLSAQNILADNHGYTHTGVDDKSRKPRRSIQSKLAWSLLNLRMSIFIFVMIVKQDKAPMDPATIPYIHGLTRWTFDLLNFVIDELFQLADAVGYDNRSNKSVIMQEIQNLNTPALHLLLLGMGRFLISFANRQFRLTGFQVTTAIKAQTHLDEQSLSHRRLYNDYMSIYNDSPVKLNHSEELISDITDLVKSTYDASHLSADARHDAEKRLLVDGDISDVLMPVVTHILTTSVDKLRCRNESDPTKMLDPMKLFFHDVRWLGLTDDRASEEYLRENTVDALFKVKVREGKTRRRCTRCGSVVEEERLRGKVMARGQMGMLDKSCVCASNWMAVP
ncbi:MAG: mediator complex subunit [Bogoriella megaspora]|nr:MAG: mediator complex subunit [Bogoriella megaspora]